MSKVITIKTQEENYFKLKLEVQQQLTHLRALTEIPEIKNNHNILASLEMSIYKLWSLV